MVERQPSVMVICVLLIFKILIISTEVLSHKHYKYSFPKNFMFGAATSAYQIEGALNVDGRGLSIWDVFIRDHPNRIADHSNADEACDSYYKFEEDIKAIKDMGMNFYRISIAWPRIMPSGLPSNINQKGIDYYNKLINELIRHKIEPVVTIFHWDLPIYLQDIGGWCNEALVQYYEDYARVLFENFGDRVKWWITFNEPKNIAFGYEFNNLAPAIDSPGLGTYIVTHNILKAHARAYHLYDKNFRQKQKGKVSIVLYSIWPMALNESSKDDREAVEDTQQFINGWYAHPIYSKEGDYPQIMKDKIGNRSLAQGFSTSRLPTFTPEEVKQIRGSADWYGLNVYTAVLASRADRGPIPSVLGDAEVKMYISSDWSVSKTTPWQAITPLAIRNIMNWIKDNYGRHWEIFITENGYGDNGTLSDKNRVDFLGTNLIEVLNAKYIDKCNVIGYTVWSLIDNFEWSSGYSSRFGLYHVDFNDPERPRKPKESAHFMKSVTKKGRISHTYFTMAEKFNKQVMDNRGNAYFIQ